MEQLITSKSNPLAKQIRALRQRKEREASGLAWVEGIRLVGEAVQLGAAIERLVVAPELLSSAFGSTLLREATAPVSAVSAEVFGSLAAKDNPQGLGAIVHQRWQELEAIDLGRHPWWVGLSGISDPGNLGTIMRTCDAVGAAGVILIGDCTDPYDGAAIRGSMGALFSLGLVKATWSIFSAWQREHGVALVGAADSGADHYLSVRYPEPLVLLMGSEREGLSEEQQAACERIVRLPMRGRSDSLNLAVATGVLLYAILEQREPTNK